ncbi:uncharacterized protein LOC129609233 [Condylostylus longicornis]|uniref:uncharacterized protein LOC129609233 n=1 Tax=Condylostylus longicornis TaxID=2530218 RepID=UPI00244E1A4B|nr:uncharacterized protein LOC129609233 [Condylostylus longicornis]
MECCGSNLYLIKFRFREYVALREDVDEFSSVQLVGVEFPENEAEWATIAKDFSQLWQFKNCVGAMDGKHIHIKKPPGTGSCPHSVVLFAVVNAKCEFIYINTGTNGRVSDGGILKRTNFYYKLQTKSLTLPPPVELEPNKPKVPFVFIGDDAFGLEENLMKPYKFSKTSREERIFNYRLSRARRVVENAFGILASRFRVLLTTINLNVENVDAVVLACCALHNFLKKENSEYAPARYIDHEDTESGTLIKGEWRNSGALLNIQQASPQNFPVEARNIRETFKELFNGSGKLSFQERMISNDQKF